MSKIIYISDGESSTFEVYLTPSGGDERRGDEDDYADSFSDLAQASLFLLEQIAKRDREHIERNAEEIAAYQRHIETQNPELAASNRDWEKEEALARAMLLQKARLIYGELETQLDNSGISFEVLAEIYHGKE